MDTNTIESNKNSFIQTGKALAEGKWRKWMARIDDPWKRGSTAILLENQSRWFTSKKMEMWDLEESEVKRLEETTSMTMPGISTFEKYAYPLIRAIYPNLVASNLISIQPMTGPAGLIFYLDFVYGSTKGRAAKGTPIWDNPEQTYSSEQVEGEVIGSGTGSATDFQGNLSYLPVRAGSFTGTDGTVTGSDDGAGNITGTGIAVGSTIDYITGEVQLNFSSAPGAGVAIEASYEYDMEANDNLPEIDLLLTSSPVIARPRKLRSRWSMEAAANLRTVHGLDAETELTAVLAEELKFEVDREVIDQLLTVASGGSVSFSKTPQTGISYQDHKQTFVDKLIEAGQLVFEKTRRAQTNWVVMGTGVANIVEALPGFVPSGMTGTMGVIYSGTLQGRWRCYKDPYLSRNRFLTGFKGSTFLETGMALCPYIPLYTTPTVTLDDFVARKGLGMLYAKKVVNSRFYAKGTVTE
jgi:hypothetical protein